MAAIKAKNVLKVGDTKRRIVWDALRDEAKIRVKVSDFFPGVPFIGAFSASGSGILACLVGDDPTPGK